MRSDSRFDDTAPAFTLVCPGYRSRRPGGGEGNLTFTIGAEIVAEIDQADLAESWAAAEELTPSEAAMMAQTAASHLTDLLDTGLSASDLTEAVTDAAVVFLLAMRRSGVTDPKRIPACTVMWSGEDAQERVFFGT